MRKFYFCDRSVRARARCFFFFNFLQTRRFMDSMKRNSPFVLSLVFVVIAALLIPASRAWCAPDDDDTQQAIEDASDLVATAGHWYKMRIGVEKTGNTPEYIYIKAYVLVPNLADPKKVQVTVSYPELINGWQEGSTTVPDNAEIVFRNKKKVDKDDHRLFFRFKITDKFQGPANILFEFRTAAGETTAPIGYAIVAAGSPRALNAEEIGDEKDKDIKTVKSPIGVGRH